MRPSLRRRRRGVCCGGESPVAVKRRQGGQQHAQEPGAGVRRVVRGRTHRGVRSGGAINRHRASCGIQGQWSM